MSAKRHEPPLSFVSLPIRKSAILLLGLSLGLAFASQTAAAQTFSVLYSFNGSGDGRLPVSPVILDAAGNVYGTAGGGGLGSDTGTVFELNSTGQETTLYEFTGTPDGSIPQAGLFRDATGNLYGTTRWGGVSDLGTVFEVNAAGVETVLHSFNGGDGINPDCALIRDSAGNFYGTTFSGGAGGFGVVFKMNKLGHLTLLHQFTGGSDGGRPYAGLIQDRNGNLYGTTTSGGASGAGTVFKLTATGVLTVLHTFTGKSGDGATPYGGLIQGAGGYFYGTKNGGGGAATCPSGCGTIYRVSPSGSYQVLHRFNGNDGMTAGSSLLAASGGYFGTTSLGGSHGFGVVYELKTNNQLVVLYNFTETTDGGQPYASLAQDSAGNLYGTTIYGGAFNNGVVFKVAP